MKTSMDATHLAGDIPLVIRRVRWRAPLRWLAAGGEDLWACRSASVPHGIGMMLLGWLLLLLLGSHPFLVAASVSGFLLVAPVMATGTCELSRRRARGEPLTFDDSLEPLRRVRGPLLAMGGVLAAIAVTWFVISQWLLARFLGTPVPDYAVTLYSGFVHDAGGGLLLQYVGTGFVLALGVFAISAVSVPDILERHVGAREAIRTSLEAVHRNPGPMALWAVLITLLTSLGFATLLIGMVVIIPWLGHASWHAYRELTTP